MRASGQPRACRPGSPTGSPDDGTWPGTAHDGVGLASGGPDRKIVPARLLAAENALDRVEEEVALLPLAGDLSPDLLAHRVRHPSQRHAAGGLHGEGLVHAGPLQ